jgi:hypothetical protein
MGIVVVVAVALVVAPPADRPRLERLVRPDTTLLNDLPAQAPFVNQTRAQDIPGIGGARELGLINDLVEEKRKSTGEGRFKIVYSRDVVILLDSATGETWFLRMKPNLNKEPNREPKWYWVPIRQRSPKP